MLLSLSCPAGAVLFMQQKWPECDRMCREVMVAHQQQKSEAGAGAAALVCDRSYITVLRQMALLRVSGCVAHF